MKIMISFMDLVLYAMATCFLIIGLTLFMSILNVDELTLYMAGGIAVLFGVIIAMFHQMSIGKRAMIRVR